MKQKRKNGGQVFEQTSRRHDVVRRHCGSTRKQPKTGPRALALNGLAPGHGRIADVARGRARPAYTMRSRRLRVCGVALPKFWALTKFTFLDSYLFYVINAYSYEYRRSCRALVVSWKRIFSLSLFGWSTLFGYVSKLSRCIIQIFHITGTKLDVI